MSIIEVAGNKGSVRPGNNVPPFIAEKPTRTISFFVRLVDMDRDCAEHLCIYLKFYFSVCEVRM